MDFLKNLSWKNAKVRKAVWVSIALTGLNLVGIALLQLGSVQLTALLGSAVFLTDLVLVLVANVVYDHLAHKGKFYWAESVLGALLGAIILASFASGMGASFAIGIGALISFIALAVGEYAGFEIGDMLM